MRVTVLGAGYMGTAMALVLAKNGHDVSLWGTWLDDDLLAPCERGEPHPKIKLTTERLKLLRAPELARALEAPELIVHGVSSDGAIPVAERTKGLLPDVPILSVTKGLLESRAGKMERIDHVLSEIHGRPLRFVHAGGPAKAIEIARDVLTWMVFAGDARDTAICRDAAASRTLHVTTSDDLAGVDFCSALKNAYATGLGIWDGLIGKDAHNARAACFTQALVEMRIIAEASGGRADTVFGPAGSGDLHVTAAAGRNRAFGEQIGTGKPARDVARDMAAVGQLTEGYPAIATAWRFVQERGISGTPLLRALHRVVWENENVGDVMRALELSPS